MEPDPWEVAWEVKEKEGEQRRKKGGKLGKGSLDSNPRCNVCMLYFWSTPRITVIVSEGHSGLPGTELVLHALLALQGIMTPVTQRIS